MFRLSFWISIHYAIVKLMKTTKLAVKQFFPGMQTVFLSAIIEFLLQRMY